MHSSICLQIVLCPFSWTLGIIGIMFRLSCYIYFSLHCSLLIFMIVMFLVIFITFVKTFMAILSNKHKYMNKHVNDYSKKNWKFSNVSFCFNVRISLDFISLSIGICQGHPLSGLLFALGPFRAYWCAMMVPFVIYNRWHLNQKSFIHNFVITLNDIHIKCTSAISHNCYLEPSSLLTKHIAFATFFTLLMALKHWLLLWNLILSYHLMWRIHCYKI